MQSGLGLFGSHGLVLLDGGDKGLVLGDGVVVGLNLLIDVLAGEDGTLVHQDAGSLGFKFLDLESLDFLQGFEVQLGIVLGAVGLLAFLGEDIVFQFLFGLQDTLGVLDGVDLGLGKEIVQDVHPCLLGSLGGSLFSLEESQTGFEVCLHSQEGDLLFLNLYLGKLYLDGKELCLYLFGFGLGQYQSGVGLLQFCLGVLERSLGVGIDNLCLGLGFVKLGNRVELVCLSNANLRNRGRFLVLQAACEAQGPAEQRNEQRFFLHSV